MRRRFGGCTGRRLPLPLPPAYSTRGGAASPVRSWPPSGGLTATLTATRSRIAPQQPSQALRRIPRRADFHVAIDVAGHGDRAVTKDFLDDPQRAPCAIMKEAAACRKSWNR